MRVKYQHGWGALLYKMGKLQCSTTSHNTKHNHNTLQPTWAAAALLSSGFAPLSPWAGQAAPKSLRCCSPTSVRRLQAVGLTLAGVDSLVWGAKIAPIKKEREGRGPGLRWLPLDGLTQQPTEGRRHQRVRGGCDGVLGRAITKGWGIFPSFGGVELSDQKMKIERAMGHRA